MSFIYSHETPLDPVSAIQKRVNIFTPSYKLVTRQNLNRNYIIIINTPK